MCHLHHVGQCVIYIGKNRHACWMCHSKKCHSDVLSGCKSYELVIDQFFVLKLMDLEGPATLPIGQSPWWFWEVFCPICPVLEKKTCNFLGARCGWWYPADVRGGNPRCFTGLSEVSQLPLIIANVSHAKKKGPFSCRWMWGQFLPPGDPLKFVELDILGCDEPWYRPWNMRNWHHGKRFGHFKRSYYNGMATMAPGWWFPLEPLRCRTWTDTGSSIWCSPGSAATKF